MTNGNPHGMTKIVVMILVMSCVALVSEGRSPPSSSPTIIIDPGHGGKDPGAIATHSRKRIREKDVVLAISKKLSASLKKNLGARVYLTRSDDRFIPLGGRDAVANRRSCDLFLSVHANASRNPRADGLELYYLNKATDSASRRLAARENAGSPKPEKEIQAIVSDLIQTASTEESADLSRQVRKALTQRLGRKFGTEDIRVKTALFYVLVGAKCPSLLIETGFVTNPAEGRRLGSASYQTELAEAVAQGVSNYLKGIDRPGGDL